MLFTKEFLQEAIDDPVEESIVETSRWAILYEAIFEHEGKYYRTNYRRGATEMQDEQPYEHDDAEIECVEVKKVEKTVEVWENVKGEQQIVSLMLLQRKWILKMLIPK